MNKYKIDFLYDCQEKYGGISITDLIEKLELIEEHINISDVSVYYRFSNENSFRLIHLTQVITQEGKNDIYVYDELEVINYQKVSFSTDKQSSSMFLLDDAHELISEESWIKELCYYFKRVPGNHEICCPE